MSHPALMYCGVFNVPCQLGAAEVGRANVADHFTVWWLNGQRNRSVCLESQARVSNCLPVKKNRRFPDFLLPALPLARGG